MQIQHIAAITNGKHCGDGNADYKKIVIDSRKIISTTDSLFVAIRGDNHDGHRYMAELAQRGVTGFIVDNHFDTSILPQSCNYVIVDNTLDAFQAIAAHHRQQVDYPILAITGSNGKTIVKEWMVQLGGDSMTIIRSPKSFNSQVGVPLSLLLLEPDAQLGIIEAGISKVGEMDKLAHMVKPTLGLFTNIGQAHQENFESLAHKMIEKVKLFDHCQTIFYCADQPETHIFFTQNFAHQQLVSWGKEQGNYLQVLSVDSNAGSQSIEVLVQGEKQRLYLPFADNASLENALHAITALSYLGVPIADIAQRLALLKPVAMRMEQKEGVNNCLIINDTYNSDITSLEVSLDFMNQQARQNDMPRTLVLSDIYQSGMNAKILYNKVNQLIEQNRVSLLIGVGSNLSKERDCFTVPALFFETTSQLMASGLLSTLHRQVILVKGSRDFGFEQLVEALEQKRHQTVLEINLNALAHNVNKFRAQLKPGTKILAMVKAFSYGSGSFEIASVMQHQKVDYLGVAFADEGVELRNAGITLPIMVMSPEKRSFATILQHALEPEIYSFGILNDYLQTVIDEGYAEAPVHIKIDTGMLRLGFRPNEIEMLCEKLASTKLLRVQSVFSHLAGSEAPEHDAFTNNQIEQFASACEYIRATLGYPFIRHILNSAGIERFPSAQFEMARLGIGLYGISAKKKNELRNVATLKSYISQIKTVEPSETIGYGRRGSVVAGGTIAVVPIGYADGLDRRLGNGVGQMMVNGAFAPIIGSICMDMCMLNVTGINANEGDEVIIFGDDYPVWNLSQKMGTISYEVLTGIGRRVPRVYYQE
jgi:Alr-MurF fusion protein